MKLVHACVRCDSVIKIHEAVYVSWSENKFNQLYSVLGALMSMMYVKLPGACVNHFWIFTNS